LGYIETDLPKQSTVTRKISIRGVDQLKLFGFQDVHLRKLQQHFQVKIVPRNGQIQLTGSEEMLNAVEKVLKEMIQMVNREQVISEKDLRTLIDVVVVNGSAPAPASTNHHEPDSVILYKKDGFVKPKSPGQQKFYRSATENDIVFVIGPAGTGKTFLAVAIAIAALRDRLVSRIVLTRPAVEAGESLGFLPGDLREKIEPYLRPLYDALHDMIPADKLKKYVDSQIIEIVPLAYMRGRTLNNAFVILDEAQNTSFNQMKMFLTRLGINSKAIITGDVTQIDLPDSQDSGLLQIQSILTDIEGIDFVYLSDHDVVRHRLVREIIKAYNSYENKQNATD